VLFAPQMLALFFALLLFLRLLFLVLADALFVACAVFGSLSCAVCRGFLGLAAFGGTLGVGRGAFACGFCFGPAGGGLALGADALGFG